MEYIKKKHPRFLKAFFGAFFKVFGWIKVRTMFSVLFKKTIHDDRIPTDDKLDNAIENLAFYMDYVWPLVNYIVKKKIVIFFKYKLKSFSIKLFLFCVIIAMAVTFYKLYNLYIEKPKIVYVEPKKEMVDNMIINTDTIFIPAERSFLTKDNLDYFASEMGIKYWYYVRKQIIVETGFTSDLCLKAHNLFGMKMPGKRETTAIGKMSGHAQFKHWVYSLYDYKLWQDYKLESYPLKKGETYPQWLDRIGYAESEVYLQALRNTNWYEFKPDVNY